ncbi:hypothetical protein B0J14DRAFT_704717 [Halenospora varia]|nr:hypothetical protein B0J14DRAFT_704717 [Halenospora varia]
MDHQQANLRVDVPSLTLKSASLVIIHQDPWTSYLNNRRKKLKVISRAYTKNKRLEHPPPSLNASNDDVFNHFRELVDPKHTSMYLNNLWRVFESTKDEKKLFMGLETFLEAILAAGADLWNQHHTLTTRMREDDTEGREWDLEAQQGAALLDLDEKMERDLGWRSVSSTQWLQRRKSSVEHFLASCFRRARMSGVWRCCALFAICVIMVVYKISKLG